MLNPSEGGEGRERGRERGGGERGGEGEKEPCYAQSFRGREREREGERERGGGEREGERGRKNLAMLNPSVFSTTACY